jgi:hypothetical protein
MTTKQERHEFDQDSFDTAPPHLVGALALCAHVVELNADEVEILMTLTNDDTDVKFRVVAAKDGVRIRKPRNWNLTFLGSFLALLPVILVSVLLDAYPVPLWMGLAALASTLAVSVFSTEIGIRLIEKSNR